MRSATTAAPRVKANPEPGPVIRGTASSGPVLWPARVAPTNTETTVAPLAAGPASATAVCRAADDLHQDQLLPPVGIKGLFTLLRFCE